MENREQILSTLLEISGRKNALTNSDKSYIKSVYYDIMREELKKTCNNCYEDALTLLLLKLKNNNIMTKSNYRIVNGVVLRSSTIEVAMTNANITDELAEKFLKENPKRIKFFATYPDDWMQRISSEPENANSEPKQPKGAGRPPKQQEAEININLDN